MSKAAVITLILAFASLPGAHAQVAMRGSMGTFSSHTAHAANPHLRASIITSGPEFSHRTARNRFPGGFFLGDNWLADYSSYNGEPGPSVVVIEPESSGRELVREAPQPLPNPLMIELQGNRYVRYDGSEQPASPRTARVSPDAGSANAEISVPRKRVASSPQLPPATLIFRDGRQEEVTDYTIVSGVMYVHADYWTSGSWTKQIQLAALDLPATLKANQQRGVKFALPSAPNEVMTRP